MSNMWLRELSEKSLAVKKVGDSLARWPAVVVVILAGTLALAAAVHAYNHSTLNSVNLNQPSASNPPDPSSTRSTAPMVPATVLPTLSAGIQSRPRELVTTVRFNLFDLGIYPREVHVKQGLIEISVEDYSGGTTGLAVEREVGSGREHVGTVQRERPSSSRGQNQMRLGLGRYQVYMADHPDNRALLVVEP